MAEWIFEGDKMKPSRYSKLAVGWTKVKILTCMNKAEAEAAGVGSLFHDDMDMMIEVEALTGPTKGGKNVLKIWSNARFILGSVLVACGVKFPDGKFRFKSENIVGKSLWAQIDERPDKKNPEKSYTEFSRWEPLTFKPPVEGAAEPEASKPAAAKTAAPADDDGIEEIADV